MARASCSASARRPHWPGTCRHLADRVTLNACDLGDRAAVESLLRQVQPDQVYHLAGYASTGRSYREPDAAWAGNLTPPAISTRPIIRWGGRPRILHVSSGLIYGDRIGRPAVDEDVPVAAGQSLRGAARRLPTWPVISTRAFRAWTIVRVRPFNHIGPRQSPEFAVANFARQIAAIERARPPPVLETGDLRRCAT